MKSFRTLILREWWEWKNMILWLTGIYVFILCLMMVPAYRFSTHTDLSTIEESLGQIEFQWEDGVDSTFQIPVHNGHIPYSGQAVVKVLKAYSFILLTGIHIIQLILFFVALFYFADSIFSERENNSSLFIRSLPVSDHLVLMAKIVAGFTGIILVSLALSLLFLFFIKILFSILGLGKIEVLIQIVSRISLADMFGDMAMYQLVSLIWFSPLLLFLMLVSSFVKKRPLIVGLGAPILLSITLKILFGNSDLLRQFFSITVNMKNMLLEQSLLDMSMTAIPETVEVFGSFSGYLLMPRTGLSILVAILFYFLAVHFYRKNITVS